MTETTETGAPATPETDIIAAGQAALKRINTQGKRLIDEWVKVGKALSIGEAIEANKERGNWHKENFPDLVGPKFASTRSAAVWLASLSEDVVQQFHNDGKLNHPVAIRRAYEKAHKASASTAGKASSKGEAPADQPPQQREEAATPTGRQLADPAILASVMPTNPEWWTGFIMLEVEQAAAAVASVDFDTLSAAAMMLRHIVRQRGAAAKRVDALPQAA